MNIGLWTANKKSRAWTAVKVVAILLLGLIFGLLAALSVANVYKQSVIDRTRTAANAIEPTALAKLQGSEADLETPEYKQIKAQLLKLHQSNRDSRFVYVMSLKGNDIIFNADSEPATSEDYSPPGQTFDEASPELLSVLKEGKDVVEGPIKDRWGIWLSGLTPIYDSQRTIIGLMGVDIPARQYLTLLALVAAFPILIGIVAAVIIAAVDVARRRRQEAIEVQAELVSVITHELNNPLTGIRWGAELLLSSYYQEGTGANVTRAIYSSVRKLQESVDDVLEIARLGRKAQELNLQPTRITPLIRDIFFTQKLPADHKQVLLLLAENWPEDLQIICDESKMKRVFNNLVSNAIKYTNNNTDVTVSYENVGGMHRISVQDHGIGIPAEEQDRVFAGFYRASNAVKSGEKGTGMGLYLVKKTVEQHGGRVLITSEQDIGTTVTVELPQVPVDASLRTSKRRPAK